MPVGVTLGLEDELPEFAVQLEEGLGVTDMFDDDAGVGGEEGDDDDDVPDLGLSGMLKSEHGLTHPPGVWVCGGVGVVAC